MGPNLWPEHPVGFREKYEAYVERMLELGSAVVEAMGMALGLEDGGVLVRATGRSWWVMRAIGYPPLPVVNGDGGGGEGNGVGEGEGEASGRELLDGDGVSCGAHTDYGCLTLLLADDTPGALQVLSHNSPSSTEGSEERWVNADPIPGTYIVNIGDMMERWTNGLWKSTRHRVVHRGKGFRVSVPFFFEPDFEARVGPLRECVESMGGERSFGEVVYGDWLLGKVRGNFVKEVVG